MKKIALIAVALLTMATVPVVIGSVLRPGKLVTVPTCDADKPGGIFTKNGGNSEGPTALCICAGDGEATSAYQWCRVTIADGAADIECTGGSSTVCP